jgi:ankyrin repeat protein
MNLPPPPQADDPIIMQFRPQGDQWELNDENIKRIDPGTGHTILHNYCLYINTTPLEVYQYLIETHGCDINAQDDNGDTPLHYALYHFNPTENGGNIAVLTFLLNQKGINGNIKNQYDATLLHIACDNINNLPLDIFKVLIETKGCEINAQDKYNDTPLHYALYHFNPRWGGDITVLTYLLNQKGINGDIKDQYDTTLLHTACRNINNLPLEIFKLLIKTLGCDINAQDDNGNTPLHYVLCCFNRDDGGDITVLRYLITQEGVNVNIKDQYNTTLLHTACYKIDKLPLEIFQYLIETLGCEINAQDNNQNTPLHYALENFNPDDGGDINVLAYLLNQENVNINLTCDHYRTILHKACTCPPFSFSNSRWSNDVNNLNGECDSILCQVVEVIAERCIQQVLDEISS